MSIFLPPLTKQLKTNGRDTLSYWRVQINFELPSALTQQLRTKYLVIKYRALDNILCK